MSVRITRLANGLTVATDRMDAVESVSLGVWVGVGARHETMAQNGVSHLLEHMAFKGTRRRSALDIVNEVESVGGHINAYTGRENTAYYLRILPDDVPLGVDILADILQNSTFAANELERERTVVLQEIGQSFDTPDDVIFDDFQAIAYPDQALGRSILGTSDRVREFSPESLFDYMGASYSPDNMVLAAAGRIDHDRLVALATEAFDGLSPRPAVLPEPARYAGGTYLDERKLEQLHVVVGHEAVAVGDPDYYACGVLTSALGGGMSSRLFQELRERRGLVYSVFAFNAAFADGGLFGVYAGTDPERVEELVPVIQDELAGIGSTITDVELGRVRAQLKAGLLMGMESTRARAERLAQHILIFGRVIPTDETVARIDAVDRPALARLAERMFASPSTIAAIGPVERLRRMLKADGPAMVKE